jgi:uncharacterized protein (DUF58 family)
MTPHLTLSGRTILIAAATFVVIGTAVTNWPLLMFGEGLIVMLTVVYYLQAAPLLALEEGFVRLKLRPGLEIEGSGGVAGRPLEIEVEVSNSSRLNLARIRLSTEHSPEIAFDPAVADIGGLRPRSKATFRLSATSGASGRWLVHGFRIRIEGMSGLVGVSNYIPTPLPLKFLPATAIPRTALPEAAMRSTEVQQIGVHRRKRRGFGTDFRELRDHVVGDPFRSIAWKATARTGQLMVREFEDEVIANAFVILDISSTMRGGTPPATKLEHAIQLITEFASRLARSQDRLGLITFDELVYGHLRTRRAKALLPDIVNHLVGLHSVVDPNFTELDDEEVVGELVRYLMVQERLDFRRNQARAKSPALEDPYDNKLLDYWLTHVLDGEEERLGDRCLSAGIVANQSLSMARRYCQLRGIRIPYRLEARFGAKERGLVQALERFLEDKRESHLLVLVSDLCGLVNMTAIVGALRVVLGRRHRVVVLMPYTPEYVSLDSDDDDGDSESYTRSAVLNEVFRLAERRERSRVARSISALGIPVRTMTPRDTIDGLLSRVSGAGRMH